MAPTQRPERPGGDAPELAASRLPPLGGRSRGLAAARTGAAGPRRVRGPVLCRSRAVYHARRPADLAARAARRFALPRDQRANVRPRRGTRSGGLFLQPGCREPSRRSRRADPLEAALPLRGHGLAAGGRKDPLRFGPALARTASGRLPPRLRPGRSGRPASPGSLEHFLVERYLLYTTSRGRLLRGRVHHAPYPLQAAECPELEESLLRAAGIARPSGPPLLHYAEGVDVLVFALDEVLRV